MKKHLLAWALAVSMLMVMAAGAWLKYGVLKPLGLYQDKNIVELPFFLLSDHGARMAVQEAMAPETEPEETQTVTTSQPSTTAPEETTGAPSDTTAEPTSPEATTEVTTEVTTDPPTEPSTAPETVPPTTAPASKPTEPPETTPPQTDPPVTTAPSAVVDPTLEFTGDAVDESWFDDVLFIGDSRTVGLREYARSGDADYFATVGMSSFNVLKDSTKAADEDFSEQTLVSLLSERTYGKIIIALGINECGYSTSAFVKQYKKVVATVREYQPDAKIIIHSIMTVGRKKAAKADHFKPDHIYMLNGKLKEIANGTDVFFIDVNDAFADSEGYLPDYFSKDGVHLYAKYDRYWADWLRYAVAPLGI